MKSWPGWLVVLAGACSSGSGAPPTTVNPVDPTTGLPRGPNGTIVHDVDGDTVDIRFGDRTERVRLIGVDTPETKKPNMPVQCYGPEASAFTARTLPPGTPVLVVRDLEARDDYGRLLGYVYVAADAQFVNLALAAQGYARPLTIAPNDAHASEIVAAARAAESLDLGLWGACTG